MRKRSGLKPPSYEYAMAAHQQHSDLPTRTNTNASEEDAIPEGDPSNTPGLLLERLQAWKHMVSYLEEYIGAVGKGQHSEAKEQERILKTLSKPLKQGHHFDQENRGVAGLFENIRSNTQAIANLHDETAKNISGTVLPMLERLHKEIKAKGKELGSGAAKQSKAVDKARNASQKHIELLGQYTANFDSAGGKVDAAHDPYVLQRGIYHRLNQQILEENNNRNDLLTVQNSFQQFEAHVLTIVQNALGSFSQFMGGQAERHRAMYGDMASTAQKVPLDFEWRGFIKRNENLLINPDAPARSMSNITFPNQGHRATKPLIEGSLERKSHGIGALTGYKTGYYALTPAGYLHEFKDNNDFQKDPIPELSLYLPDCSIGGVDGVKFHVKGKDVSGGKLTSKMHLSSEYQFKAHTPADAQQWHSIIMSQAGKTTDSVPASPIERKVGGGGVAATLEPGSTGTNVQQQQQSISGTGATPTSAAAGEKMMSPTENTGYIQNTSPQQSAGATGPGSHFYGTPATNEMEERKY
ncbi:hypothetical protein GJ744_009957 [Endocarpon pusillum]|uniref:PH domain-containing protein n=1 Tax=Endocarpon pusillum TaxID=364733 RepID=A0A8H7AFC8_9EURO|nr:hypothetical protein GJ744_009957 [Endocarpon pusillum]